MKLALRVTGLLLLLMGPIWFLQGANVLTAGSSPMIGDTKWEYYGGLATLIGVALLVVSRGRRATDDSPAATRSGPRRPAG